MPPTFPDFFFIIWFSLLLYVDIINTLDFFFFKTFFIIASFNLINIMLYERALLMDVSTKHILHWIIIRIEFLMGYRFLLYNLMTNETVRQNFFQPEKNTVTTNSNPKKNLEHKFPRLRPHPPNNLISSNTLQFQIFRINSDKCQFY